MKTHRLCFTFLALCILHLSLGSASAQGTAFTYQGQLTSSNVPLTGPFDLEFSLYNAASGGTQVGNTVTNPGVGVTNGLFTTTLDFGAAPFSGQALWVQIAVSPAGSNTFATLSPLQPLTSAPYAVQALNADTVTGSITLAQLPSAVLTNGATNVTVAGMFSGDGGGLTNLNASQLTGTLNQTQLPTNVLTNGPGFPAQTNVYSTAGVTNVTVPAGQYSMIAKLWGAGGGGGQFGAAGGGGAFVEVTLSVFPGQTFTIVVGQHGDYSDSNAGGAGSGDTQGGNATNFSGQGGQASSLFYDVNSAFIMEAVAGGGGGGGSIYSGGPGGNPGSNGVPYYSIPGGSGGANGTGGNGTSVNGVNGGTGSNYAVNANSTGIASLASANGNGGFGGVGTGGGGGGGYGGGGGGGNFTGGGGGGSYGQIIFGGTNNIAGNNGDPSYVASAGNGGGGGGEGNDGLVVIIFPGESLLANIPATVVANGFVGNGGGLTNLQTSSLIGPIYDSQLQSDVALLDQSAVFTRLVTASNGLRLNNSPLYLRAGTDTNHGLAYAGTTISNFGTNLPDGPVLWGYTGGVLGTLLTGSPTASLSWNTNGVTINGSLSASGSFSGNASGLTNLKTAQLSGSVSNNQLANSSVTINTGTGLTGGGVVALGSSLTLTNTGVTSLTGGGGVTVSAAQGAVTLGSTAATTASPSTLVERDASANITASNYNGSGSALTSLNAQQLTMTGNNLTDQNFFAGPAGNSTTSGWNDSAFGIDALVVNTTGSNNTAIGYNALNPNRTGAWNTALGSQALQNNGTGYYNTALGANTLANLGYYSLGTSGSNNIALGFGAGSDFLTNESGNIDIGNTGNTGDDNITRIGTSQTNVYIAGIYGVTASSGTAVLISSSGKLGTMTSSARFKTNIQTMGDASDALLSLRPVTFNYKPELDPKGLAQFGLIAEEVEKVDRNLVVYGDDGKPYTVRYEAVNAMLLNEFLKEHKKVQGQETEIQRLKADNEAIGQRMAELEKLVRRLAGKELLSEK